MASGRNKKLLSKTETIAFVYRWTQLSTGKWYIGSRSAVGCHPDDGYICSSDLVRGLILAEPHDWSREILSISLPVEEIRNLERTILTELDARNCPDSFNKSNADMGPFVGRTKGKRCINDGANEKFVEVGELDSWYKLGWKLGRSPNFVKQISTGMTKARADNPDWPSVKGNQNNKSKRYEFTSPTGQTYLIHGELQRFCDEHNLSRCTVNVSLRQGWIPKRGRNAGWKVKDLDTGRENVRDTRNHGESITGERNPYYGGKRKN